MFLTENELKDTFWKNYNGSGRALRFQFECPIREGNADLVTVEKFQDNVQINAFEFKLTDVQKAILQAKGNSKYVHKSWIVVPAEKEQLILNKYLNQLQMLKYIGIMGVEEGGRWKVVFQPRIQTEIVLNQAVLNMLI